ncbi:MAG: TetR/AcrR family transcriptional regulator [bacterium]
MTFRASFEHRDDLLRAALDEFCDRGFHAASVNRILATSGMSKGQLYHHFAGKEDLYLALVEWMIDQKSEWLGTQPPTSGGDLVDTIGLQLRASLDFAAAHPDADRLSRAILGERDRPIFGQVVRRFAFDPGSALGSLVARHYARGQIRRDLSLAFVQRAILLIVNRLPELLELDQPSDLAAKLDELLAFLRGGLAPPPRRTRSAGRPPRRPMRER